MHLQGGFSPEEFKFRGLHPDVSIGTASDRYAGWIGQVYSADRYAGRIRSRQHKVGGRSFTERVLPIESVQEYFEHFGVLELDFTFYRPLLETDGRPTQNYHALHNYRQHLGEDDPLLLKVPQIIFAQKLRRGGKFIENPDYLNAEVFAAQFYAPAVELLGSHIRGFVFEQEYQRKQDRSPHQKMAEDLDRFFESIPRDDRYHIEIRTEPLLTPALFSVMRRHGVGQVLSHWTWLPSLRRQFALSDHTFANRGGHSILRLLTPRGMRYEEAYAKAHPFDRLVEGMATPGMIEDTVGLMEQGIEKKARMNVIVNNRAGGNAPLTARQIVSRFAAREQTDKPDTLPSRR
jgi:uncharacterized protein YecE (DUF72 family)